MAEPLDLAIREALWYERGVDGIVVDVVIERGVVTALGPGAARGATGPALDAGGAVVSPGFFDLHCHLRVPGQEAKETIATGTAAAAAGGFTRVLAMANTSPPLDSAEALGAALRAAHDAPVRVLQAAAVTVGLEGRELAPMDLLAQLGAAAFSDDGKHLYDAELGERALSRAAALGRPVLVHAEDAATCAGGQADPSVAGALGVAPWPCAAEVDAVVAMLEACRRGGGHLHVQHVSCAETVELVRAARAEGLHVTAEATPHHLALTSGVALEPGVDAAMAKVNPPLRAERDRAAVVAGLRDGTIDAIATDHAPHEAATKQAGFTAASFGISGFETALPLVLGLVDAGELTLGRAVEALTEAPWRCLRQQGLAGSRPGLRRGEPADLVLFDPRAEWTVDPEGFASRGHNTPLRGRRVRGRTVLTVSRGSLVHSAAEMVFG